MNERQLQAVVFLRNAVLRCKQEGLTLKAIQEQIHECGKMWFPEELDERERELQATLPDN